uniref:Uncharacterized protein n=1 Tax=Ciona savignyi TaxID=51511 RepID=H2ZGE4_CIOSA
MRAPARRDQGKSSSSSAISLANSISCCSRSLRSSALSRSTWYDFGGNLIACHRVLVDVETKRNSIVKSFLRLPCAVHVTDIFGLNESF